MGAHQKIDRVARKHIELFLPEWLEFPSSKQILHFEGKNGPDGIKRKSPAIDEPWHFIDPLNPNDTALLGMIDEHIANLVTAINDKNEQRMAFEAAWMAHSITDGLTPAHHFPLENALKELRGGKGLDSRTSIIKKSMMTGETATELIRNNWQFWGAKGVMSSHLGFEAGIANSIAYKRFKSGKPTDEDIQFVKNSGFRAYFLKNLEEVVALDMYNKFIKSGWTLQLVRLTNDRLIPIIVRTVVLGWLAAVWRADES